MNKSDYKIKENSFWAKLASHKLNAGSAAIVLGSTIHLFNITKNDFVADTKLLQHELCHVKQFRQYGFTGFIIRYAWESIRHGYYNNRYEIEARNAEEL